MNAPLQAELNAALVTVLSEIETAVNQLELVLDAERIALGGADAGALNHAGESKQILMRRLEQLDAERLQMSAATPACAQALQKRWNNLLPRLKACREANEHNGRLVARRLSQVRRALAALTGDGGEGLYGRSGELHSSRRSVPLAEA